MHYSSPSKPWNWCFSAAETGESGKIDVRRCMSVRALIVCCVAVVGFVRGALAGYAAGRMMGGPPWGWGWGDWLGMGPGSWCS